MLRKYFHLAALVFFIFILFTGAKQQPLADKTYQDWLQARYEEAPSIKPGMTRADLLELFVVDGGIQRIPPMIYCLKSCKRIKIEVELDTLYGREYQEKPDTEMKIIKISKPFLEPFNYD